jgi:AraC-like DNA-binding protein
MLVLRKPDQKSNSRLHFKCYCLHLSLNTPSLFEDLDAILQYYTFINHKTYQPLSLFRHLVENAIPETDYFASAKILELVYHLKKDAKRNKKINQTTFKEENLFIQKAFFYVNQNYQNEKSLTDIAYKCGFSSQSYFSKIFKKHTLLPPSPFRQNSTFKYENDL